MMVMVVLMMFLVLLPPKLVDLDNCDYHDDNDHHHADDMADALGYCDM